MNHFQCAPGAINNWSAQKNINIRNERQVVVENEIISTLFPLQAINEFISFPFKNKSKSLNHFVLLLAITIIVIIKNHFVVFLPSNSMQM
jgi:hypothetical protein